MNNEFITKVYLLNVPLENDYKNTLYFNSLSQQQAYFQSKINSNYTYTDFSYQRKDSFIRVPDMYDNLLNCNYVMYQNSKYSNKWFYAFITDLKYVSSDRTDVYIDTDVMQTYMFDITVKESFVEREHVSNDTIGLHTIPEGLETGEYKVGYKSSTSFGSAHVVVASTWDIFNEKPAGSIMNGLYQGVDYYLISSEGMYESSIKYLLSLYADKGKSEAIIGLFMVPDSLTNYDNITWDYMSTSGGLSYFPYKKLSPEIMNASDMGNFSLNKPLTSIDGYTPKNKKLFTYPFQYLLVSNNNGSSATFKYENFSTNPINFNTKGVITPGCSIRTAPLNYKGIARNNEEGLNLGKYPICSYNTDMYTNWLTQNSVNLGLSVASSLLTIGGGALMMSTGAGALAGAGSVTSGLLGIGQTLGQVYQQSLVPPQAEGNQNCGDVIYANGECNFTFYQMNIKEEYARIIDKYFDMFGYRVNMVKVPNKAHRSRYWFTKTIDVNIDGAIPNSDMQKIKNAYNNGITFWRNADEIQNYSLSNDIALIN